MPADVSLANSRHVGFCESREQQFCPDKWLCKFPPAYTQRDVHANSQAGARGRLLRCMQQLKYVSDMGCSCMLHQLPSKPNQHHNLAERFLLLVPHSMTTLASHIADRNT